MLDALHEPLWTPNQRPPPPPDSQRDKLNKAISIIDSINANDPRKLSITPGGDPQPYRVVYSSWVAEWVRKLDPKAADELILLAKGRNVEGWKLAGEKCGFSHKG